MKDSKIRRTFQSSDSEDSPYKDYSALPTDSNKKSDSESTDRIFMSVQRKDLSATRSAFSEPQTKPNDPFYNAQPKGMYFESGSKVVDDYASRTDWRDRIRQAVAESESRVKPVSKEPTPWSEAPSPNTIYRERVFEETKSAAETDDDILWEIDEKYGKKSVPAPAPIPTSTVSSAKKEERPAFESSGKKVVRAEAYTAWLAERNAKIIGEEEQLIQTAAAKQRKLKRSEAYDFWISERDFRIAEEDARLKADVAAKQKKQKQAEAHSIWLAERESRIAAEDAQLKVAVAANLKKQKQAEAHSIWLAERESRIAAEDAQLKVAVAANLKKQKQAEAHSIWLAERESRIAAEDAQLKADVAVKQRKQKQAEAYDTWKNARDERIAAEESELLKRAAAAKEYETDSSVFEESLSSSDDFKEIEEEFEAVFDETAEEVFEQPVFTAEDSVIEIYKETESETDSETDVEILKDETDLEDDDEEEGEEEEIDEAYENELRLLMGEKKNLEQLRFSSAKSATLNPDDEFVV
ncbi:hypothetical protein LJC08_00485 [Methanimicrococcus sp. OttesenSCG-928-J09]|nr:hypothetical protein [Methanimicrococcus sp. OttesenSCG-928-J09]